MTMRRTLPLVVIALATLVLGRAILSIEPTVVADPHDHGHDDHDHDHGGGAEMPSQVEMSADAATAAGATLSEAGPGAIALTVPTTGTIVFDSAGVGRARARFAGIVRDAKKGVGDKVTAGETLALVESNDSLQVYPVKAPIAGTIIERNTNVGEIADDSALFVIADPARVLADLHVFSKDLASVAVGQGVALRTADGAVAGEGSVATILPVTEMSTQTVVARVRPADADGRWRPGMIVDGEIAWSRREVEVAVPEGAIQTINDKPVVFVDAGKVFEVRQVLLGIAGGGMVEVIEGLYPGETYVSANSFIMKADAGKASAEHQH